MTTVLHCSDVVQGRAAIRLDIVTFSSVD